MEVLVRVVESGSDSGTARRLRVGQPAVCKTVAQLKEGLSVGLLLRSSRGLTPTGGGQNSYVCAKRSIERGGRGGAVDTRRGRRSVRNLVISSGVVFSCL